MATQTFSARVNGLTGINISDYDDLLNDWCSEGAIEVINHMPDDMLWQVATTSTFNNNSSLTTLLNNKLLSVTMTDGTREQPCREIPVAMAGRAGDSTDMAYATVADPVYYKVSDGAAPKIKALPDSTSPVRLCTVHHVTFVAVNAGSDTAIATFPNELEHVVVLYASIKAMEAMVTDKVVDDEDTELAAARSAQYAWLKSEYDSSLKAISAGKLGSA